MTATTRVHTIPVGPDRAGVESYVNNHGALPLYIRLVLGTFVKHGWAIDSGSFVRGGGNWFADLRKDRETILFAYLPDKALSYVIRDTIHPTSHDAFGSLQALEEHLSAR